MNASLQSLLGIFAMLLIAWGLSENRRVLAWRGVIAGVVLQFVLALVIQKVPLFQRILFALNQCDAGGHFLRLRLSRWRFGALRDTFSGS